jgi:predicted nucleic acid-binding protein
VRYFAERFHVAEDGPEVTENLLSLVEQVVLGGKQVHDANIVATMLAHEIGQVLTHNVKDFARFSSFITVLPLEAGSVEQ